MNIFKLMKDSDYIYDYFLTSIYYYDYNPYLNQQKRIPNYTIDSFRRILDYGHSKNEMIIEKINLSDKHNVFESFRKEDESKLNILFMRDKKTINKFNQSTFARKTKSDII